MKLGSVSGSEFQFYFSSHFYFLWKFVEASLIGFSVLINDVDLPTCLFELLEYLL